MTLKDLLCNCCWEMCSAIVKFSCVLYLYRIKIKVFEKQMDLITVFKYKTKKKLKRGLFGAIQFIYVYSSRK